MNVIRVGSAFPFRSSCAARPIATRSRDWSRSTASSSVMRSPSRAFSRICLTITSDPRHGAWHRAYFETAAGRRVPPPHAAATAQPRRPRRRLARKDGAILGHSRSRAWHRDGSCGHGLSDEAELRHLVELADVARQLEERHQPRALARAEAVAELLEVPRQEPGRIPVAIARLPRKRFRLRARLPHGADERVLEPG